MHILTLLIGVGLLLNPVATQSHAGETPGIIGRYSDPGSGVLVSGKQGASTVEAIFQVGQEERAPFAREQVTLAPTAKRVDQMLTVTYNYQAKRLAAKIPGGLGAFWEMDLQNEEGQILRDVYLETGGTLVQPVRRDGGQTEFAIGPMVRAPYHVVFRLEFFKRSESFRFRLEENGTAHYEGAGPAGPGVKDPTGKIDPDLPKRDQPPQSFTNAPPKEGALASRVEPPKLLAPAGWERKRGTWLTATEIKDRPQDLGGLWVDADSERETELEWFDYDTKRQILQAGSAANRGQGFTFLDVKKAFGSSQWKGLVHVCPRPDGTCPNLCRWVPGSLVVEPGNLHAKGEWHGKKTKTDCSGFTDQPDSGPMAFKRFIGVSFVPLLPGKYIHLVAAPAVGNQPSQFKAAVQLATHYEGTSAADVRVKANGGTINVIDKKTGAYQFLTERSGIYELTFDLVGKDGEVFHTDRVRIEIPSIPGIGR